MPIRFRRTLKIAPGVKINFSKSGISTTVGPKGFHFTFNKRGVRRDVSIPGTGVSDISYIKKNETKAQKEKRERAEARREAKAEGAPDEKKESRAEHPIPVTGVAARHQAMNAGSTGLRNFFVLLAVVVFFFAGAAMLGLIPAHFVSNALQYLARLVQSTGH